MTVVSWVGSWIISFAFNFLMNWSPAGTSFVPILLLLFQPIFTLYLNVKCISKLFSGTFYVFATI